MIIAAGSCVFVVCPNFITCSRCHRGGVDLLSAVAHLDSIYTVSIWICIRVPIRFSPSVRLFLSSSSVTRSLQLLAAATSLLQINYYSFYQWSQIQCFFVVFFSVRHYKVLRYSNNKVSNNTLKVQQMEGFLGIFKSVFWKHYQPGASCANCGRLLWSVPNKFVRLRSGACKSSVIEKRASAQRSNQCVAQSDPSGCSCLMKMTLLVIWSTTWTHRRNRNDKVERSAWL